jgi:hypothetical protein
MGTKQWREVGEIVPVRFQIAPPSPGRPPPITKCLVGNDHRKVVACIFTIRRVHVVLDLGIRIKLVGK